MEHCLPLSALCLMFLSILYRLYLSKPFAEQLRQNLGSYIICCCTFWYVLRYYTYSFSRIYIYIYIYIYILLWDYNRRGDKNYISKHIKRVGQPNNKSRNNLLYANKHKLKRNLSNEWHDHMNYWDRCQEIYLPMKVVWGGTRS